MSLINGKHCRWWNICFNQLLIVIGKKHFCPGRLAGSEYSRSVIPSWTPQWRISPRPESMPHVASLIALRSLFRHFILLCQSSLVNKDSGIGANCDHTSECVHWEHACIRIAIGDTEKNSPRVLSTLCSSSVGRRWEDIILPCCEDPRYLRKWDSDLNYCKTERVFLLYDKMRWKWDAIYLLRGLLNRYSASLIPPPLALYLRTPTVAPSWYTWRPWSSYCEDALRGRDWVNFDIHFEAVMDWVWSYTGRPWSSKFGDAVGGDHGANSETDLEAVIKQVWTCTWRPWLSEFGHGLGGRDRASLDMHLEA